MNTNARRRGGGATVLGAVVVAAMVATAMPGRCLACSCAGLGVEGYRQVADVVFRGTVLDAEQTPWWEWVWFDLALAWGAPWDRPFPSDDVVRLRVEEVWKGAPGREITVHFGGGTCNVPYEPGGEVVVFARQFDGAWHTGLCDGSFALAPENPFAGTTILGPGTPVAAPAAVAS